MHPYKTAPSKSFWSRSVSDSFNAVDVFTGEYPLIRKGDAVISAGSCFASNLVPYLERAGFLYLRTEITHPRFTGLPPENFGYDNFSAKYGNIYTVRQRLQRVRRSYGSFFPEEDRWISSNYIVDPFRPALRYAARSHQELDIITARHLAATREALEKADVFIFTLGLTEAWVSRFDGAVFPACPGTVAGDYDPERYSFDNFDVNEVIADLSLVISEIRSVNRSVRFILTVSPVPLVATATGHHVLAATTYSKSVLRVAAEHVSGSHWGVSYFPAYELVTGPQAPDHFFEADRRNVSAAGVNCVMSAFLAHCEAASPAPAAMASGGDVPVVSLSRTITEAECEEAMLDSGRK